MRTASMDLEKISAKLDTLMKADPATKRMHKVTGKMLVHTLIDKIDTLLNKGYSLEEVYQSFVDEDVTFSLAAFKGYVYSERKLYKMAQTKQENKSS